MELPGFCRRCKALCLTVKRFRILSSEIPAKNILARVHAFIELFLVLFAFVLASERIHALAASPSRSELLCANRAPPCGRLAGNRATLEIERTSQLPAITSCYPLRSTDFFPFSVFVGSSGFRSQCKLSIRKKHFGSCEGSMANFRLAS